MNETHLSFLFNTVCSTQTVHWSFNCSCDTCYNKTPKHQQSCVHILGHAAALLCNCSRWKRPRLCLSLFNIALSGLCGIFSKQCIVAAKCTGVLYQCSVALLADDPKTSHLPCFLNKQHLHEDHLTWSWWSLHKSRNIFAKQAKACMLCA